MNTLTDLLPLLASAMGDPQHRAGVMQGFLQTRRQFEQEDLLKQQAARQDQLAQAQIGNLNADNARADQQLQIEQGNAGLNRMLHFREAAGQQASQLADAATDPLAAQNELAAQSIGLRRDFGVPPSTAMPTPNMAGMISGRKKKRAGELYAEAEKRFGPEAMASDSITLKSPEFGDIKPSALRQMFETPAVSAQGAPAVPYVKPVTPGTETERAQQLLGKIQDAKTSGDSQTAVKLQREYDNLIKAKRDIGLADNTGKAGDEPIAPDDVMGAAQAILSGRMAPSQLSLVGGMGNRGVKFKQAVVAEVNKRNPTFNWAESESGYQFGKSTGTQTTVRMIDNIEQSVPLLLKASDDFQRSGVRLINKATLAAKDQFGDTSVSTFNAARLGLADEIAKILSGGGTGNTTSDAKLKQANELLAADMTPKQLRATVVEVQQLLANRRTSLTKGTFMEKKGGGSVGPRFEILEVK